MPVSGLFLIVCVTEVKCLKCLRTHGTHQRTGLCEDAGAVCTESTPPSVQPSRPAKALCQTGMLAWPQPSNEAADCTCCRRYAENPGQVSSKDVKKGLCKLCPAIRTLMQILSERNVTSGEGKLCSSRKTEAVVHVWQKRSV